MKSGTTAECALAREHAVLAHLQCGDKVAAKRELDALSAQFGASCERVLRLRSWFAEASGDLIGALDLCSPPPAAADAADVDVDANSVPPKLLLNGRQAAILRSLGQWKDAVKLLNKRVAGEQRTLWPPFSPRCCTRASK